MMRGWFGASWGAPVCEPEMHRATPVGQPCLHCSETIVEGDQGLLTPHCGVEGWSTQPSHYECYMRAILGGANHIQGRCTCCGGDQPPDPPGLSPREAAKVAARAFEDQQRRRAF